MKRACVAFAQGCPRSMLDAALLVDYFRGNGWEITSNIQNADIVLVGTCAFTSYHENVSMKYLAIADRKKRGSAKLVAFGCLPGINEKKLLKLYKLTPITRKTLHRLDTTIDAKVGIREFDEPHDMNLYTDLITKSFHGLEDFLAKREFSKEFIFKLYSKFRYGNMTKYINRFRCPDTRFHNTIYNGNRLYNIRIATGCLEFCSYCVIRKACGSLISSPFNKILSEFNTGLSKGYRVFHLSAEDVGAYGQDIGSNIAELLGALFEIKRNFKLTFSDFSPKWLVRYFPDLFELLTKNKNRIGSIGLPIQSGSDKILRLMRREYAAEEVKKCLLALEASTGPRIDTHVIVGFPGETEEDFCETINFLQTVDFDRVVPYVYSDRSNTLAIKLPGKILERIKIDRWERLVGCVKGAM